MNKILSRWTKLVEMSFLSDAIKEKYLNSFKSFSICKVDSGTTDPIALMPLAE